MKLVKQIFGWLPVMLLIPSLTGCYEDFVGDSDIQNMGFAINRPMRTVMSDKNVIYVGVSIAGKREVDMKDWAEFEIDPSLVDESLGKVLMPEDYYILGDPSTMRVRKSNLPVADVSVSFTDAFYNDPEALTGKYVIPFRVTRTSITGDETSIREGAEISLVAVKYINQYSGVYYRLTDRVEIDADGNIVGEPVETPKYDLVNNKTVTLASLSPTSVYRPGIAGDNVTGGFTIELPENTGKSADVDVTFSEESASVIVNRAVWRSEGDYTFFSGDEVAPQFEMDYKYESGGKHWSVKEKLVLRQYAERDLRVETW
ncbi:MAG: DUF1735 domain-containing protein [Candidatus Cryptobacteroides sp.]